MFCPHTFTRTAAAMVRANDSARVAFLVAMLAPYTSEVTR